MFCDILGSRVDNISKCFFEIEYIGAKVKTHGCASLFQNNVAILCIYFLATNNFLKTGISVYLQITIGLIVMLRNDFDLYFGCTV